MRLHLTGASGAGVSTLGRALAERLALPYVDSDDVFWLPSDPPYRHKRPIPERLAMLDALLIDARGWAARPMAGQRRWSRALMR